MAVSPARSSQKGEAGASGITATSTRAWRGNRRKKVVAVPFTAWSHETETPSTPTESPRYSSNMVELLGACIESVTCCVPPPAGPTSVRVNERAYTLKPDDQPPPQQRRSRQ